MKEAGVKIKTLIVFGAVLVGLVVVLWPFKADYSADDRQFVRDVYDRPNLRDQFSIFKITTNEAPNAHYVPVLLVTFSSLFKIFNGDPRAFFIFNLVIHYLNGVLFYLIFLRITKRSSLVGLASLIFLFHPSNLSTVSWISAGLTHGLTMFFSLNALLGLQLYREKRFKHYYAFSLTACLCAYLTKPLAYSLPLILFLFDWTLSTQLGEKSNFKKNLTRSLTQIAPYFILLMPFIVIAVIKYPFGNVARIWGGMTFGIHPLLRGLDLVSHILIPLKVSPELRFGLVAFVYFACFFLLLVGLIQQRSLVLFSLGWLWSSIFLMLSSNFRPITSLWRYHYYPMMGLLVILISVADILLKMIRAREKV